ncbi:hypothetical protein BDR05DRAFT_504188 [Suillus weaverae]|nr:hypothetical protein BDR05DRAFT_504188 [Suillus weaverae]
MCFIENLPHQSYPVLTSLQTLCPYFVEGDIILVGRWKTFSKRIALLFYFAALPLRHPARGSSSKRKATDTLESATKRSKVNPDDADDDTDEDLDVTVQTGLYVNLGVNYLLSVIVIDDGIWYYDRQGIIQCSGINFIQDLQLMR